MKKTKKSYEEYLNDLPIPEEDKRSNGGLIPDNSKYGSWIRKNDPIQFEVAYSEWRPDKF